jgi:hypothetical protein
MNEISEISQNVKTSHFRMIATGSKNFRSPIWPLACFVLSLLCSEQSLKARLARSSFKEKVSKNCMDQLPGLLIVGDALDSVPPLLIHCSSAGQSTIENHLNISPYPLVEDANHSAKFMDAY